MVERIPCRGVMKNPKAPIMTDTKDLPLTSAHWGTYRAKVSNGRVQELIGFEHDTDPLLLGAAFLMYSTVPRA